MVSGISTTRNAGNGHGVLAQLVERQVRNLKVRGSIPLCSTKTGSHERLPVFVKHALRWSDGIYRGSGITEKILGGNLQLKAANACTDIDIIVEKGRFVYKCRISLLHPYRRTAAANIPGQPKEFLHMHHLTALVSGNGSCNLQVNFEFARNHAYEYPVAVTPQHQSLEDSVYVLAEGSGYLAGRKIILGIFVRYKFIFDAGSIQKPRSVSFLHFGTVIVNTLVEIDFS